MTDRERALAYFGELASWKAIWESERTEDLANGIPRKPLLYKPEQRQTESEAP